MKISSVATIVILILASLASGEKPAIDSSNTKTPVTQEKKTAETPESPAQDEEFDNPFLTNEEQESAGAQGTPDSLAAEEPARDQSATEEPEEEQGTDILLDLGIGVSMPRFDVDPATVSTQGKPKFIFMPGILIPFGKRVYTQVSLRYLQLCFELSQEERVLSPGQTTWLNYSTRETLTFISLPLLFGMRFQLGPITPYFFGDLEPAVLTAGHQFCKQSRSVVSDNGGAYYDTLNADIDVTKLREPFQIFIGGGAGFEFSYGYGMVYIDGSIQYGLRKVDKTTDTKSLPMRTSNRVLYFPVSLGVRFYL